MSAVAVAHMQHILDRALKQYLSTTLADKKRLVEEKRCLMQRVQELEEQAAAQEQKP